MQWLQFVILLKSHLRYIWVLKSWDQFDPDTYPFFESYKHVYLANGKKLKLVTFMQLLSTKYNGRKFEIMKKGGCIISESSLST